MISILDAHVLASLVSMIPARGVAAEIDGSPEYTIVPQGIFQY